MYVCIFLYTYTSCYLFWRYLSSIYIYFLLNLMFYCFLAGMKYSIYWRLVSLLPNPNPYPYHYHQDNTDTLSHPYDYFGSNFDIFARTIQINFNICINIYQNNCLKNWFIHLQIFLHVYINMHKPCRRQLSSIWLWWFKFRRSRAYYS
jgi:hypothetical protein